jgi:hypothetical protein
MPSRTKNTLFVTLHAVIAPVALLGLLFACQLSVEGAPAKGKTPAVGPVAADRRQLIIKFKPRTVACDANGIAALASATGTRLEFVRPMSGDACVIQHVADRPDNFSQGESALKRHPAVESLELDAIVNTF